MNEEPRHRKAHAWLFAFRPTMPSHLFSLFSINVNLFYPKTWQRLTKNPSFNWTTKWYNTRASGVWLLRFVRSVDECRRFKVSQLRSEKEPWDSTRSFKCFFIHLLKVICKMNNYMKFSWKLAPQVTEAFGCRAFIFYFYYSNYFYFISNAVSGRQQLDMNKPWRSSSLPT